MSKKIKILIVVIILVFASGFIFISKTYLPLPNLPLTKGEEQGRGLNVINKDETKILEKAGIEIKEPSLKDSPRTVLEEKLSGSFQMPTSKTEYSLPSLGKDKVTKTSKVDPYRIDPNE